MEKTNDKWSIEKLQRMIDSIEFPEYQREPSVWDLNKKRKLIDSIIRGFDIASIYLLDRKDGMYDCIDGRQRINAILSFLGINISEEDGGKLFNGFEFIGSDELTGNDTLKDYYGKSWEHLSPEQKEKFLSYKFNVVIIDSEEIEEKDLNLMFLRLQLGAPLNGGEKLNAMLGEMRDLIFKNGVDMKSLGNHEYFVNLKIPKRRYSKELTACQIALNYFSLKKNQTYCRSRFLDLQIFLKQYIVLNSDDKQIFDNMYEKLCVASECLESDPELELKNRAMGVTFFLFISKLIDNNKKGEIDKFVEFIKIFLIKLKEQVEKGYEIEQKYRDLLKFQTYITQAAVERYAIENREKFLEDYFEYFKIENKIKGE
ncbi:MAG: DUF262 domain-containing protein [Candidatus Delongbacteria bacterium]|jgi:hypothetical protein|nr:DUF262 domain-containing protein [Candidatus Delongbacteria bacterium]